MVFKGRGFRPREPDFRIELELARVSRQNHLLHALVNPSVLKPAKAGAASLVVLQMFTKLQKLGQPPKFVQIENADHLLSVQNKLSDKVVPAMLEWMRENAH